jgi:disulfide bond formation protein DsbB
VPYFLGLLIGLFGFLKPSNTKMCIYVFLTFLISMALSGYHVGIEQELYQSIFNCSDDNLNILEGGKLLESLSVINPDCRNVNFAIFGVSLATINFVLSFVISSVSYYLYSNAKN